MYALVFRWLLLGCALALAVSSLNAATGPLVVRVSNGYSTNVYARMQLDGAGYDNVRLVPAGGSTGWTNSTGFHWSGTRTVTVKWGPSSSLNNLYFSDPSAGYSGIVNGEAYTLDFSVGPTAPVQFWIRTTLFNFSSYWETNTLFRDEGDQPFISDPIPLPPRTTGHPIVVGPFDEPFPWGIFCEPQNQNLPTSSFENLSTNAFSTHGPTSTNPPSSYQSPNDFLPAIGPGTPITTNWTFSTGDTNGARDSTLREGFSGLRSILEENGQLAHFDAEAIRQRLEAVTNLLGPVTNAPQAEAMAAAMVASLEEATEEWREGAETMAASSSNALRAVAAGWDGAADSIEGGTETAGDPTVWELNIAGQTVNVDPRQVVGPLIPWIYNIILFGLTYFYVKWSYDYFQGIVEKVQAGTFNPDPKGPESIGSVATAPITIGRILARCLNDLALRGLVIATLTALPGMLMAISEARFGSASVLSSNPVQQSLSTPWMREGVKLLTEVVPVKTALTYALSALAVQALGASIWIYATNMMRIAYFAAGRFL